MTKKIKMIVSIGVSVAVAAAIAIGVGVGVTVNKKSEGHTHNLEAFEANAATCTDDGNIAYWYCDGCGKYFSDSEAKNEISENDTVIPAVGHNWSAEWSYNEESHWHACLNGCGETNEISAHTDIDEDGICDVCGYELGTDIVSVTGVTLDEAEATLTEGDTLTLTATVLPSDATNKAVTWSSSDENVATVSNGLVTAVGEGTATITVTTADGAYTATCEVTVNAATVSVTGVTLDEDEIKLIVGGDSFSLTATISPANATNKNVTWESSNESVATVSDSGVVTAVAAGTATITVTTADGNKTATCTVTVTDNVSVTGVTLSQTSAELNEGDTLTLTATVSPSDATNKAVTWSSSNESVATVSDSGVVTAVAAGKAIITVTTADGNKTATCTITVTATSSGDTEATPYVFDYDYFIANCGVAEKTKTTQSVQVGIYTVAAGVYYENSASGLNGKVINTQGAADAFTFTVNGDVNSVYAIIKGGSSDTSVAKAVTLRRVNETGETIEEFVLSEDLASGTSITLNMDNLPAGTYILNAVKSVRVAELKVTEYTLPHVCGADLTHYDAVPATCTEDGTIEYWVCNECGKMYADEDCAILITDITDYATGHTYSESWSYDETGHWHACIVCGAMDESSYSAHDTNGTGGSCSECGYIEGHTHNATQQIYAECEGHAVTYWYCAECGNYFLDEACTQVVSWEEIEQLGSHDLEFIDGYSATCTAYGAKAYWYCSACDKYWLDNDNSLGAEINYADLEDTIRIDMIPHSLVQNYNASQHWMECEVCGYIDQSTVENHNFSEASGGEMVCDECGYSYNPAALENVAEYGAYEESMYVVMNEDVTDSLTVTYSLASSSSEIAVPSELIRTVDGQTRVDIIGISAGTYDINLYMGATNVTLSDIEVEAYDRSGYAHFDPTESDNVYANGLGAYENDGTLKDGTLVIYLTDENKNDISDSAYVYNKADNSYTKENITSLFSPSITSVNKYSIGYFLNNRQYSGSDRSTYGIWAASNKYGSVDIRIIGTVNAEVSGDATASEIEGLTAYDSTDNGGSVGDNGRMARMVNPYNLTIEGVGEDACIFGWGVHFIANDTGTSTKDSSVSWGESFEVRNITFQNYPEDAVGMEGVQEGTAITVPVQRCWIHNNVFLPGYCAKPAESDKAEGDGSCDFKRGYYYTFDYNYLEGCHKTNLIGSSDSSLQYNLTFHHNWWNNCGSRIPLTRRANVHYYNNYISGDPTGTLSYVISPRANCYIFAESNYFDGCKNIISGSGGTVKFYGNTFYACYDDIPSQVSSRDQVVSNSCKDTTDGTDYSTFETDPDLFYDAEGTLATDSVTARKVVMESAGVHGFGYETAPDMNEMTPTQTVSVGEDGLTVDLSQVAKTTPNYVSGVLFTNITGNSSGTIKGKGQIVTFTLTSEAQLTLTGTGSGAAAGELVGSDGTVYASKISGTLTIVLEPGTYFIASGIKDKEFTITELSFADTSASSAARIEAAINAINALPDSITLSDESAITAARMAYGALTASEKEAFDAALVTKLEEAEAALGNLKVENVISLIDAIGTVSEDSYDAINAARVAYNSLSTDLQAKVTNYATLTAAETEYAQYAVSNVEKLIDALVDVSTISITDKDSIDAAYSAYDAAYDAYLLLDEDQTASVGAEYVSKLTEGIAKLEYMLAPYNFLESLDALDENNVTLANGTAINALQTAYNGFDEEQKTVISEEELVKYNAILEAYTELASQTTSVSFTSTADNYIGNSDQFSYVGSTRTNSSEQVTVDGVTYTTSLKMESSTSITFTTATDMSLTLYFLPSQAGNKVKIDGTSYTIQSDGTVTVSGLAAGSHSITKDSTNCYLFLIVLSPSV